MKRASVVVAAIFAVASVSAFAGTAARPALRLVATSPLKVRGVSFKRNERVRVVVAMGETRRVRRVRATRSGTFTVTFPGVAYDRCLHGLVVTAAGGRGSAASIKLPMLLCPPPL